MRMMIQLSIYLLYWLSSLFASSFQRSNRQQQIFRRSVSFDVLVGNFKVPDLTTDDEDEDADLALICPEFFLKAINSITPRDSSLLRKIELGYHPTDINYQDEHGDTFLMNAIRNDHFELTMELLMMGADPAITNNNGWNAVHLAAVQDDPIFLQAILSVIDEEDNLLIAQNNDGNTPLILATLNGRSRNCKLLLNSSLRVALSVNMHGHDGNTALIIAVRKDHVKITKTLLCFRASLIEINDHGMSALRYAFRQKSIHILHAILNDSTLAQIRTYARKHAVLSQAIINGSASLVVYLAVDLQLDLNRKESIPGTSERPIHPLIRAVNMCSISATRCLIVHGADPDIMDENGYTPLMHAARDGKDVIARCLLQLGADPLSVNPITDETPLSMAQENEDVYMANIIMSFAKSYL